MFIGRGLPKTAANTKEKDASCPAGKAELFFFPKDAAPKSIPHIE